MMELRKMLEVAELTERVFDENKWELAEPGAMEILKEKFLIPWAELHMVDGILYNGKIVKNGFKRGEKPLILRCEEYKDPYENYIHREIMRENYSLVRRGRRPFIIPDDPNDNLRDSWSYFFKVTGIKQKSSKKRRSRHDY